MSKQSKKRPSGGRTRRGNYETVVMRVPKPLQETVEVLIDNWHRENEKLLALPLTGDWWQVLDVEMTASQETVKEAFRSLAKRYHPDTNKGYRDAEVRFKAINEAYEKYKKHFQLSSDTPQ